jgi:hydrogenase nickel incorporation protein HypA/HybF
MHEMSIAQAIYRQIKRTESEHPGMKVVSGEVEVGPLSGVEPLLLQLAFADLMGELGREIKLDICEVPLKIRCLECAVESDLEAFRFLCSGCGSVHVQVISGDQIEIRQVMVAEA